MVLFFSIYFITIWCLEEFVELINSKTEKPLAIENTFSKGSIFTTNDDDKKYITKFKIAESEKAEDFYHMLIYPHSSEKEENLVLSVDTDSKIGVLSTMDGSLNQLFALERGPNGTVKLQSKYGCLTVDTEENILMAEPCNTFENKPEQFYKYKKAKASVDPPVDNENLTEKNDYPINLLVQNHESRVPWGIKGDPLLYNGIFKRMSSGLDESGPKMQLPKQRTENKVFAKQSRYTHLFAN